jgi:hypothetical protein
VAQYDNQQVENLRGDSLERDLQVNLLHILRQSGLAVSKRVRADPRIRAKTKKLTCSPFSVLPLYVCHLVLLYYYQAPGNSNQVVAPDGWATREYLVVHSDDNALRLSHQLSRRCTSSQ